MLTGIDGSAWYWMRISANEIKLQIKQRNRGVCCWSSNSLGSQPLFKRSFKQFSFSQAIAEWIRVCWLHPLSSNNWSNSQFPSSVQFRARVLLNNI